MEEDEAFQKGWIAIDGFVSNPTHRPRLQLQQARFSSNPSEFVKQLTENRNASYIPITSPVGSIIFNSQKLLLIFYKAINSDLEGVGVFSCFHKMWETPFLAQAVYDIVIFVYSADYVIHEYCSKTKPMVSNCL